MFFKRSAKPTPETEEAELIGLYRQSGDLAQLSVLYERYVSLVWAVCMKYLKDEEESKDMAMEVFEKLAVELRHHEVKNFKSWLHVLTRNQCLMWLRAQKSKGGHLQKIGEDDMESGYGLHHEEEDALEPRLERLEDLLDTLPDEQKTCLRLFYMEEKCYQEIATITGFDMKQVKSYLQNGKRNLKIKMEKNERA